MYAALELGQPGNPACPDQYNEASTLLCPRSTRLLLQVSGQAIRLELGVMQHGVGAGLGAVQWQDEKPFLPVAGELGRRFDAVRVRNYTPGAPAQVLISADQT